MSHGQTQLTESGLLSTIPERPAAQRRGLQQPGEVRIFGGTGPQGAPRCTGTEQLGGVVKQSESRWLPSETAMERAEPECGLMSDVARSKGRTCPTRAMRCH